MAARYSGSGHRARFVYSGGDGAQATGGWTVVEWVAVVAVAVDGVAVAAVLGFLAVKRRRARL